MTEAYDLYVVTCLDNGKRYVGQTRRGYLVRWNTGHRAEARNPTSDRFFVRALRKHGDERFVPQLIMQNLDSDEADFFERHYISLWNTHDPSYGYNSTSGGKGGTMTRASLLKSRETTTGMSVVEIRRLHVDIVSAFNDGDAYQAIAVRLCVTRDVVRGTVAQHRRFRCLTCFDGRVPVADGCCVTRPRSKMPNVVCRPRGERQGMAHRASSSVARQRRPLVEVQALHARVLALREGGTSYALIAKTVGVGKTTVCNVVRFHNGTCPVCGDGNDNV